MKPDPIAADPFQEEAPRRVGSVSDLNELPEVASYLRRVGATPVNFRAARVSDESDGYPRARGTLKFDATGKVTAYGDAQPPTEEEQEAITAAFGSVKFPTLVTLNAIAEPPPACDLKDKHVWMCHEFDGRIGMVLQRYDTRDGRKGYLSWTRWSDGLWRNMEPDTLPFYGLQGYQNASTLCIHEGAKAAARLKRLQSGEERADRCPWFADLQHAQHVGWLGGVHALDRSNWAKLASLGWKRVIVIADNEPNGVKATRWIATEAGFSCPVELILFDRQFPRSFDLGDEWPAEQFDDRGRYTGPSLRDCAIPATQATLELPSEDRGRPRHILRDEFAELIAYTAEPPRIIFLNNPSRDYRPETFNLKVAPFSDLKDTAAKVWARLDCQHDRIVYRPGYPAGTLTVQGERCFNVYEGGNVRPVKTDTALWLAFLSHLFPVEAERELVARWLATLIAKPRVRMRYGLLLISLMQGVGKNTLGKVLQTLLGRHNVSFPNESDVVDSQFNGWAARKRLIFIGEFYSGHSRKAYDKMKPLIADDEISVNEKGVNQYDLENWATVIACSNSEHALHIDDEDRRWLVPTVTEVQQPKEFWDAFNGWLASVGPGAIQHWAEDYVARNGHVQTGDHAPWTSRKGIIVEGSQSDGKKLAKALGEHIAGMNKRVILRLSDVRKWVAVQRGMTRDGEADLTNTRLEAPATITAALKKVPGITVWADKKRPKFGVNYETVFLNFDPGPEAKWEEVKEHLTAIERENIDEF